MKEQLPAPARSHAVLSLGRSLAPIQRQRLPQTTQETARSPVQQPAISSYSFANLALHYNEGARSGELPQKPISFQPPAIAGEVIQRTWIWKQKGQDWISDGNSPPPPKPKFKGKQDNQQFPESVAAAPTMTGLAGEAKQKKIQPYLDLLDHLGGELKGKNEVSGGHLLTAMQAKFGNTLVVAGQQSDNAVWECSWQVGNRTLKQSTMFPAAWTVEDLRAELEGSTEVSGKITLKSGIKIKKAGETFYPEKG
jgi:Bacterial EndoU nuclease